MRRVGRLVLALLPVWFAACDRDPLNESIRHPTPENVPTGEEVVRIAAPVEARSSTQLVDTVATIGSFQGTGMDVFGEVADMELLSDDGPLLVLDRRMNEIRAFDLTGTGMWKFGREGRGPGEFMDVVEMEIHEDLVFVLDRSGKIHMLERAADSLHFRNALSLGFGPEDFCVVAGRIIAQGWSAAEDALLHTYSLPEGTAMGSYGSPYQSDNWLIEQQLSDAVFDCDDDGNVVLMFESLPFIRYYAADSLQWSGVIESFRPVEMFEETLSDGRPALSRLYSSHPYSRVAQITSLGDGEFLVQVEHFESDESEIRSLGIDSYLVDVEEGTGTFLTSDLPLVHTATGRFFLASKAEPYPVAYVLKRR